MQAQVASYFSEIRALLIWLPDWVTAIALVLLAIVSALALHAVLVAAFNRAVSRRHVFFRTLIERTRGPTRLALIIFMLGAVLPVAPFEPEVAGGLGHVLLVAFVVLVGWIAMVAIDLAADLYLQRYQMDAEDNLLARKHTTQVRILQRAAETLVILFTAAGVLMTFDSVRQYGVSLFASAGLAGIVVGFASRPVLTNLIAGLQIAVTQPIRLDDVVIVEGEWGRIEEITATYVVVRIWDLRRLIVPLSYFIEQPFQNWTRESSALLAPVVLYLDYTAPIDKIRAKVDEIAAVSPSWDGKVKTVQVTGATADTIEVRALLSARNSGEQWGLRCEVREKLIAFLQAEHPEALPRQRQAIDIVKRELLETAAKSG